ncbi:hypothetical protein [Paenibacillus oleatilyticus]|uniref:hypothetical protein n=1 Tax=Paenibacillus oleatilyticus TaxID=2594886 RepID=UPI001C1F3299|nr:hypothetical protein [Paenibacillus oleatilyticus]MBU7315954.1 hypothetical protein [Paenibacillus oleatilyticus]
MKKVKVTYFKPSGKYYTEEFVEIPVELSGYDALHKELPKHHRIKNMFMLVQNSEPDGEEQEPYIVPHLFHPIESWGE